MFLLLDSAGASLGSRDQQATPHKHRLWSSRLATRPIDQGEKGGHSPAESTFLSATQLCRDSQQWHAQLGKSSCWVTQSRFIGGQISSDCSRPRGGSTHASRGWRKHFGISTTEGLVSEKTAPLVAPAAPLEPLREVTVGLRTLITRVYPMLSRLSLGTLPGVGWALVLHLMRGVSTGCASQERERGGSYLSHVCLTDMRYCCTRSPRANLPPVHIPIHSRCQRR